MSAGRLFLAQMVKSGVELFLVFCENVVCYFKISAEDLLVLGF